MRPGDPWGGVTRLIAAVLLERPDLVKRVAREDLAPGPYRDLVEVIRARHSQGRPADHGALLQAPELARLGGDAFLLAVDEGRHLVVQFDRYCVEAHRLAAVTDLRRELDRLGGPDEKRLTAAAARLSASPNGHRKLNRLDVLEMVHTTPPAVPWIAEPLLVRGALTLLVGREGEGKSLIALALGIAVAAGESVAGFWPKAGRVLYVDAENAPGEVHRRIRALGLPAGSAERLVVYDADGLDLRRDLDELGRVMAEERPALMVLDSFRSLWGGSENDSEEVAPVLDALRNLGRRHDTATLLLHHTGKVGAEYRGSTAIGASAELIFMLAREREDDDPQRRFLACRKSRPAPEPGRRWLRLSTELGMTFVEECEPPDGVREKVSGPVGRPPRVREELAERVREVLVDGRPWRLADVARAIGRDPKNGSVRRVLEALAERGEIERRENGRYVGARTPRPPIGEPNNGTPSLPLREAENGGCQAGCQGGSSGTPPREDEFERWEAMADEGEGAAS